MPSRKWSKKGEKAKKQNIVRYDSQNLLFYEIPRFISSISEQLFKDIRTMAKVDGSPEKVCKTIHQYSKGAILAEDMKKLQEIARDCQKVKNYVYARYGGIGSLGKLYPGYTIQNEMTKNGLRQELGLPSVYFYLAMFDALKDIRSQWTRIKNRVLYLVGQNEGLSREEKHYLRFLLGVANAFDAILNQRQPELPVEIQKQYEALSEGVDIGKLNRYLCRQVRKYHAKQKMPHTEKADGFSVAERAYRYGEKDGEQGIYLSTKESRRRIFVPLTDGNCYKSQLYVRLIPQDGRVEIDVPIYVAVHTHADYSNVVGISLGMFTMLTAHNGHVYGTELGSIQMEYAGWMREQTINYNRNREINPGRKKYSARKRRYVERLHSYINHELNRFLQEEKPQIVYMAKLPVPQAGGVNRKINHSVTMWQRGYIRERLVLKCREQSVELTEVLGKDISRECSRCGAMGEKKNGIFTCRSCGCVLDEKTNTAQNARKRGMEGKIIRS